MATTKYFHIDIYIDCYLNSTSCGLFVWVKDGAVDSIIKSSIVTTAPGQSTVSVCLSVPDNDNSHIVLLTGVAHLTSWGM